MLRCLGFVVLFLASVSGAAAAPAGALHAPLRFEPIESPDGTRFVARSAAYGFSVSASELQVEVGPDARLRIGLDGAVPQAPEGLARLPGASHYLRLDAPETSRRHVPHYAKVAQRGRYPGIDLVAYGHGREIEYDFVLAPGADPARIALHIDGADAVTLAGNGDLHLRVGRRTLVQRAPVAYQPTRVCSGVACSGALDRRDARVDARYRIDAQGRVRFVLGRYDRARPLVIDPILVYSTLLGGEGMDVANGIAVASDGSTVVAGRTRSEDFPLLDGLPESPPPQGGYNGYVTRFTPDGSGLVFSTWFGGLLEEGIGQVDVNEVALDANGRIWVVGAADEADEDDDGGHNKRAKLLESRQAFVLRLSADGSEVEWFDLFGGWANEEAHGIALAPDGSVYVCGDTGSDDFPLLAARDASKGGSRDAFVRKYGADDGLLYSTFLGGDGEDTATDCAVGPDAQPVIVGYSYDEQDIISTMGMFVFKLPAAGIGSLVYSHIRFGGSSMDLAYGVAIDAGNNAFVVGTTDSTDFPLLGAVQDANAGMNDYFLCKFGPTGTLLASTYYGDAGEQMHGRIALDGDSRPYLAGNHDRSPEGRRPLLAAFDAAVAQLRYELGFSAFPGTDGGITALAVGPGDHLHLAGDTWYDGVTAFPTSPGAFDATPNEGATDVFVARISPELPQVNAANQGLDEGSSGPHVITVTVQLTPIAIVQTPVPWQTAPDSATAPGDFVAASGTLVFAPGESVKTIALTVNGDTQPEADESFLVRFGPSPLARMDTPEIRITLRNDDSSRTGIFADGFE